MAIASVALAAGTGCNKSSGVSPTPAPTVSATLDPNITKTTVLVSIQSSPTARIPVMISTPAGNSTASPGPRPGTPFATVTTAPNGEAIFYKLKPGSGAGTTYCWVAQLSKNATSSTCADALQWQYTTIVLGT